MKRVHRTYVFHITLKMVYQLNVIRINTFRPVAVSYFQFQTQMTLLNVASDIDNVSKTRH
jgi:hypothetical protein